MQTLSDIKTWLIWLQPLSWKTIIWVEGYSYTRVHNFSRNLGAKATSKFRRQKGDPIKVPYWCPI